jgi:membrane-associated phospholipid phosphatase
MTHHATAALLTVALGLASAAPCAAQAANAQTVEPASRGPSFTAAPASFGDLLVETLADFRRLPSWESATILSIGAVGAASGHTFDQAATRMFATSQTMETTFTIGESLGSARTQAAAAFATYLAGRITKHPRLTAVGADLVSAQIVTQSMTAAMKFAANRGRPDGTNYSFPSGHSSTAFATATVLHRHLGWKIGIPAYGAAAYVAASRIQVERHYLSDVVFGAAVGIVGGRAVTVGSGRATFDIAAAPVPGGGAVTATLVHR